jgi:CHASE2 domain-containing sensor protein
VRRIVRCTAIGAGSMDVAATEELASTESAKPPDRLDQRADDSPGIQARVIWRDFGLAVGVMAVLLFFNSCLEAAPFLEPLHNYWLSVCEGGIQRRAPPLVIYDIHDLRPVAARQNATELITPRPLLKELIDDIAQLKPRAIGLDIDMSSFRGEYNPVDVAFLDWVMAERRTMNVPIYVGVHRTVDLPRGQWLYAQRFAMLGAATSVPTDPTYMIASIGDTKRTTDDFKPTMALALAAAYNRDTVRDQLGIEKYFSQLRQSSRFGKELLRPVLDRSDSLEGRPLQGLGYLTDYSAIDRIRVQPVMINAVRDGLKFQQTLSIDTSKSLDGLIVLIGDAHAGDDSVLVPWQRKLIPGVELHASGAYTLAMSQVYELSLFARMMLDAGATLLALTIVALIRLKYVGRSDVRVVRGRLSYALMILLAGFLLATCIAIDRYWSIVWDDFLLVVVFLVFHPLAERWFERIAVGVGRFAPRAWEALFLERQSPRKLE